MSCWRQAVTTVATAGLDSLCGWGGGWVGGVVGGLGVIIESNLNRVRLSCCWVGVGLGCDNIKYFQSEKINCNNNSYLCPVISRFLTYLRYTWCI